MIFARPSSVLPLALAAAYLGDGVRVHSEEHNIFTGGASVSVDSHPLDRVLGHWNQWSTIHTLVTNPEGVFLYVLDRLGIPH